MELISNAFQAARANPLLVVVTVGAGVLIGKTIAHHLHHHEHHHSGPNPKFNSDTLILGYWKIRGLAQPIRFLLEYTRAKYEEESYVANDEWYPKKNSLGFDFPNLPYLIDGPLKLAQSQAILRYIGRKFNLLGKDEKEETAVDQMLGVLGDFGSSTSDLAYGPNYEENAKKFETDVANPTLRSLQNYLGNKNFICGSLTIADFVLYERIDVASLMFPGKLDSYPQLKAYKQRFENLDAIKSYRNSPRFSEYPVNGSSSNWGFQKK